MTTARHIEFPDAMLSLTLTINLPDGTEINDLPLDDVPLALATQIGEQVRFAINSARMLRGQTPSSLLLVIGVRE